MRIIETRTRKLLEADKGGLYTQAVRRKQLKEIELLMEHYVRLLKSSGQRYREMIKQVYPDMKSYNSFLKRLHEAERAVLVASASTVRRSTKKDRVEWFSKIEQTFRALRQKEAKEIFS